MAARKVSLKVWKRVDSRAKYWALTRADSTDNLSVAKWGSMLVGSLADLKVLLTVDCSVVRKAYKLDNRSVAKMVVQRVGTLVVSKVVRKVATLARHWVWTTAGR